MKTRFCLAVSSLLVFVPALYASPRQPASRAYVLGTVLQVEKDNVYSPGLTMGGNNPSDAPLTSRYYAYEVSVRVDCKTYVGRYETPFNYLPSLFTPDQPIRLRLTKHVMYFDLPYHEDLRMAIVHRRSQCGQNRE